MYIICKPQYRLEKSNKLNEIFIFKQTESSLELEILKTCISLSER